jgi:hypothetical protein
MAEDDTRSLAGMSDTDRMVFTVLSNPERVNLSNLPRVRYEQHEDADRYENRIEELPRIEEEDSHRPRDADTRRDDTSHRREEERHTRGDEREERHARDDEREERHARGDEREERHARGDEEETRGTGEVADVVPSDESRARGGDDEDERRTLLLDLRRLEIQGIKLTKEFTMEDRTEDMLLEIRRHTLAMDEASNVTFMRDSLRLFVTGVEMVNNRIGLLDLEGWSSEVVRDLHKHDANLSRIYRKYWRRSTSTSPELDICMSLIGSMGMHHMKRKMSQQLMSGAAGGGFGGFGGFGGRSGGKPPNSRRAATPPSSGDEEAPP